MRLGRYNDISPAAVGWFLVACLFFVLFITGCSSSDDAPPPPTTINKPPPEPTPEPSEPLPIPEPTPAPEPTTPPSPIPLPTPPAPPTNTSATLSWTPPTTRLDGSVLEDLAGYTIYYGNNVGIYDTVVSISNAGLSEFIVDNLMVGTYYFIITVYDSSGLQSPYSNEVTKTII